MSFPYGLYSNRSTSLFFSTVLIEDPYHKCTGCSWSPCEINLLYPPSWEFGSERHNTKCHPLHVHCLWPWTFQFRPAFNSNANLLHRNRSRSWWNRSIVNRWNLNTKARRAAKEATEYAIDTSENKSRIYASLFDALHRQRKGMQDKRAFSSAIWTILWEQHQMLSRVHLDYQFTKLKWFYGDSFWRHHLIVAPLRPRH